MYKRIKDFLQQRQQGHTKGGLRDRIAYFSKAEDRRYCLDDLKEWNLNLEKTLSLAKSGSTRTDIPRREDSAVGGMSMTPLEEGRRVLNLLTAAIRKSWTCSCSSSHDAMISLDYQALSFDRPDRGIDFLVRGSPSSLDSDRWFEGRFEINRAP